MKAIISGLLSQPTKLLAIFSSLLLVYGVYKLIYNIFFNKLRHIPGPKINALSVIPYARNLIGGTIVQNAVNLHREYGEVVRISPIEVSFISGETAFPDIYGFRIGKLKGHLNMGKDPLWYIKPANGTPSLLHADDEDHSRIRRVVAHAFSEKALSAQEELIQGYVDQLVDGLKAVASKGTSTDMVQWYKWTMFDLIADLSFGEPFGCLQDRATHKYVDLLFASLTSLRMSYILAYYPWLKYISYLVVDTSLIKKRQEYLEWITSQCRKRMARETTRPDFMTYILANNSEKGSSLTEAEIMSNAGSLIIGGSETTSTLLSGVTWLLLTHPEKMRKLRDEIRTKFTTYDSITIPAVNDTPYLIAVITEGLRYFPPIAGGFGRQVNKGGEYVSGYWMPEGTVVSVSHYAAYHSERNFKDPDAFVPERWLDDPEYANDNKAGFNPFSFGPRGCLGRTLAYSEMRLILAKLMWSFDFELQDHDDAKNWLKRCKVMRHWDKPELMAFVRERKA